MWACRLLTEPWKIPDKVTALPTPIRSSPGSGGEGWGWEDGGVGGGSRELTRRKG